MSHGLSIMLLKKSRATFDSGFLDCLKKRFDGEHPVEKTEWFNTRRPGTYPTLLDPETNSADFVCTDDGCPYNIAINRSFNSCMDDFRNHFIDKYGRNAYNDTDRGMFIDRPDAEKMLFAVEYILLGKYDRDLERLFDNEYIDIFGSLSKKYVEYSYRLMFPDDKEYCNDSEDFTNILEILRNILGVFADSEEEDGYKLYVEVWG